MTEDDDAGSLSRSQTAFLVAELVASVISFQLNATMLGPAIRDIDTELVPGAFAAMANYFYLSGAIANVVFIRSSERLHRPQVRAARHHDRAVHRDGVVHCGLIAAGRAAGP